MPSSDRISTAFSVADPLAEPPILALWALRALKKHRANARLLKRVSNCFDGTNRLLVPEGAHVPKSVAELDRVIDARHADAESQGTRLPDVVARNLRFLQERVPLTTTEEQVLVARAFLRVSDVWDDVVDALGGAFVSDMQVGRILGAALNLPPSEVIHALRPEGALRKVGLLDLDEKLGPFDLRLAPLAGLPNALLRENADADELIAFAARRASPAQLPLTAFPQLRAEISLVCDFLLGARSSDLNGVNVLLHGDPGTGKTELVRSIAADLSWALYEVTPELPAGYGSSGPAARFRRYRFLQQLLSRTSNALVIFDEIEDVFPRGTIDAEKRTPKAEINHVLETNPVPAFWVSNRVEHLDPAYLRRFDLIVEVGSPPKSVRKQILEVALGLSCKDSSALDSITAARDLTPGVLARAARVVCHAAGSGEDVADRLAVALKGYRQVAQADRCGNAVMLPRHYDLTFVNATESLQVVSDAITRHGRGRVLLHGPPGTGKTAFANYLALRLDRPLLQKRASDIFSPWLGESERSARRMFDEARDEGAVLFLDEADSVLRDRQGAIGRWEGPVVNEILTGMERFDSVFICATNLVDILDPASLRRFTFKVGFSWLTMDQRWRLLVESFRDLAEGASEQGRQGAQRALSALDLLAPGDFTTVSERARLGLSFGTLESVVAALAVECQHKPGARRSIGF